MAEGLGFYGSRLELGLLRLRGYSLITVIPVIPVGAGNPPDTKTKPPDFRFNIREGGGRAL